MNSAEKKLFKELCEQEPNRHKQDIYQLVKLKNIKGYRKPKKEKVKNEN